MPVQVEEVGVIPGQGHHCQSPAAAGLLLHSSTGPLSLKITPRDESTGEGAMYTESSHPGVPKAYKVL